MVNNKLLLKELSKKFDKKYIDLPIKLKIMRKFQKNTLVIRNSKKNLINFLNC